MALSKEAAGVPVQHLCCSKCGCRRPAEKLFVKSKSLRLCCDCNSLSSLLQRQLGSDCAPLLARMEGLDSDSKEKFWSSLRETREEGSRFSYASVRDVLKRTLAKRMETVRKVECGGTYKSLSRLATEGYSEEELQKIEANCSSIWDKELEAWTYKKTEISTGTSRLESVAETEILDAERKVRKRKALTDAPSLKSIKDAEDDQPEPDLENLEQEVLDLLSESDDEANPPPPSGKSDKAKAGKEAREAKKAAAKEQKATEKARKAAVSLASRALPTLLAQSEKVEKALMRKDIPDLMRENLVEFQRKLNDWKSNCQAVVVKHSKSGVKAALPELGFGSDKAFKSEVQALTALLKGLGKKKSKGGEKDAPTDAEAAEATESGS